MDRSSFTELEFISLWNEHGNPNYTVKKFVKNDNCFRYIIFDDVRKRRRVAGKIVTRLTEGETCHWMNLNHRSLARLLEIITFHPRMTIFISTYMEKNLREIIHEEKFINNPYCFTQKKSYLEDILWGLEYLHMNSLCLMNISDEKIWVCENSSRAIISDFSKLSKVKKATKNAFDIPLFYRPPELSHERRKDFDPIAAEMWSFGVMALEVFLRHMVPWALVNYAASHVSEIVSKLDFGILKAANVGSDLRPKDLEGFKNFEHLFFQNVPGSRCSAKTAAIAPFIRSSKHGILPWRKKYSPRWRLKRKSSKNRVRINIKPILSQQFANKCYFESNYSSKTPEGSKCLNNAISSKVDNLKKKGVKMENIQALPNQECFTAVNNFVNQKSNVEKNFNNSENVREFMAPVKDVSEALHYSLKEVYSSSTDYLMCSSKSSHCSKIRKEKYQLESLSSAEINNLPFVNNKLANHLKTSEYAIKKYREMENAYLPKNNSFSSENYLRKEAIPSTEEINSVKEIFGLPNTLDFNKIVSDKTTSNADIDTRICLRKCKSFSPTSFKSLQSAPEMKTGSTVKNSETGITPLIPKSSSISLNKNFDEKLDDIIPFVFSVKRRLEYIDTKLYERSKGMLLNDDRKYREMESHSRLNDCCKKRINSSQTIDTTRAYELVEKTTNIERGADEVAMQTADFCRCRNKEHSTHDNHIPENNNDSIFTCTNVFCKTSERSVVEDNCIKSEISSMTESIDSIPMYTDDISLKSFQNEIRNEILIHHSENCKRARKTIKDKFEHVEHSKNSMTISDFNSFFHCSNSNTSIKFRDHFANPSASAKSYIPSLTELEGISSCRRQDSYKRAILEEDILQENYIAVVRPKSIRFCDKPQKPPRGKGKVFGRPLFQVELEMQKNYLKYKKRGKSLDLNDKKKNKPCKVSGDVSNQKNNKITVPKSSLKSSSALGKHNKLKPNAGLSSKEKSMKHTILTCLCID